jgi:lipopolysaccharide transport system ATP-binding protein
MCSDTPPEVVVRARGLGKCYHVYQRPQDRLRQFFARRGRRHYSEFWALQDLDLDIHRGETLGILGRNGAGKSTLLELVAGTLEASRGEVVVDGRVTALLELGSGFHDDFTGRENVYVAGAILELSREEMDRRIDRIAAFADIGEFLDRPVKTYSKGMFARLSFSVYANLDPDIFIVDEALAVGDAKFRHKCMHRFRQMQEQGVSIVYVSHDAASMKHICDRVVWIDAGRLRMVGPPDDVVDAYLTDLFHGEQATATAKREAADQDGAGHDTGKRAQPLPKSDERIGSGRCTFVAARFLDADGNETELVVPGRDYVVEVTVENHDLDPASERLSTGFWISNTRGLTVAAINTIMLDGPLPAPDPGDHVTIRFTMRAPLLASDSYAVTLNVSSPSADGEPILCERLVNALHFRVAGDAQVTGVIGLECRMEVDA